MMELAMNTMTAESNIGSHSTSIPTMMILLVVVVGAVTWLTNLQYYF
jgi:hypothetical protein